MTKGDQQKFGILAVLLAVFGVTAVFGYRMTRPPALVAAPAAVQKISVNLPPQDGAHIRLDLLENPEGADLDIGKKNLFQYRQAPLPPPPAGTHVGPPLNSAPPIPLAPPAAVKPPANFTPPPPPIPLKFQGFGVVETPDRTMHAFLADDVRHYDVTVGEILMGRYRIISINDKSVEVEDLQFNRRQTLPYLK